VREDFEDREIERDQQIQDLQKMLRDERTTVRDLTDKGAFLESTLVNASNVIDEKKRTIEDLEEQLAAKDREMEQQARNQIEEMEQQAIDFEAQKEILSNEHDFNVDLEVAKAAKIADQHDDLRETLQDTQMELVKMRAAHAQASGLIQAQARWIEQLNLYAQKYGAPPFDPEALEEELEEEDEGIPEGNEEMMEALRSAEKDLQAAHRIVAPNSWQIDEESPQARKERQALEAEATRLTKEQEAKEEGAALMFRGLLEGWIARGKVRAMKNRTKAREERASKEKEGNKAGLSSVKKTPKTKLPVSRKERAAQAARRRGQTTEALGNQSAERQNATEATPDRTDRHGHPVVLDMLNTPGTTGVSDMFNTMDDDHDGEINFEEFGRRAERAANNKGQWSPQFQKEVKEAFNYMDANGDGKISMDEFAGATTEWSSARKRLANRLKSKEKRTATKD